MEGNTAKAFAYWSQATNNTADRRTMVLGMFGIYILSGGPILLCRAFVGAEPQTQGYDPQDRSNNSHDDG